MMMEDTEHYSPLTHTGIAEFSKHFPSGEHIVRGKDGEEYTVAMLHQLRCLDIVRDAFVNGSGIGPLTRHCLNYLRQSILCLADTRLEPVIVSFSSDYVCSDWEALYDAIDEPLV
ncbi:hypothetical protein OF83DRAFT_1056870 [Amylostereum chailletii]|nr:hypothetical protein OF83DRAFT_1056870 [Amylostereum chailletii]